MQICYSEDSIRSMKLFYCGFNEFGQLPLPGSAVPRLTQFPLSDVLGAALSWSHVAVLSGSTIHLSGFVDSQSRQLKCLSLPDSKIPKQVSCSQRHVLVVESSGDCWQYCLKSGLWRRLEPFTTDPIARVCCGSTFDVGISVSGRAFVLPSPIYEPGARVTHVSCGNEHCLLLTEMGTVFSWGLGSRGQLGHGDLEREEDAARQVEALEGMCVMRVAAGGWHSAAVTDSGDLYTWGWNSVGQLGFPTVQPMSRTERTVKRQKTEECVTVLSIPLPVDWPCGLEVNVKDVSCGSRHTVTLLGDGSVWGCGWNAHGQLGTAPEDVPQCCQMRRLELQDGEEVTGVQCGSWSTTVFVKETE